MTPGLRTSEFKVAVLTVLASIYGSWNNTITDRQGFYTAVAGAIAYIVSRGLAKYEGRGPTPPTPPIA